MDTLPAVGTLVRIKDDADGSGSMAKGKMARVVETYRHNVVFVELVDGPTEEMEGLPGKPVLDLYPDEYEVAQ